MCYNAITVLTGRYVYCDIPWYHTEKNNTISQSQTIYVITKDHVTMHTIV